jgi:predicted ABC-type transport system involved in lysophospholipase L1 biosynthesis ATPase subunit
MSKVAAGRIEIRNLSKTYMMDGSRIDALKGVNLDIVRGDSLAILGVSGAGKSTLLHILGTLDHPTEGSFLYDGMSIFEWDEKKLADFRNRKVGFVFQFHHLLPEFTSLENTMMPALISGMSRAEARRKAEAILDEAGLTERRIHKPGELSGGGSSRWPWQGPRDGARDAAGRRADGQPRHGNGDADSRDAREPEPHPGDHADRGHPQPVAGRPHGPLHRAS